MNFDERIDAAIETLKAERAIAPPARTTRADDAQLDFALELLHDIQARIAQKQPPSGQFAHANLSRLVTESWNLSSPLSRELVDLEQLYLRRKTR
jgi:hypothetical protein